MSNSNKDPTWNHFITKWFGTLQNITRAGNARENDTRGMWHWTLLLFHFCSSPSLASDGDGVDELRLAGTSCTAPTPSFRWCSPAGSSRTARTYGECCGSVVGVESRGLYRCRHGHLVPKTCQQLLGAFSVSYIPITVGTKIPGLRLLGGTAA